MNQAITAGAEALYHQTQVVLIINNFKTGMNHQYRKAVAKLEKLGYLDRKRKLEEPWDEVYKEYKESPKTFFKSRHSVMKTILGGEDFFNKFMVEKAKEKAIIEAQASLDASIHNRNQELLQWERYKNWLVKEFGDQIKVVYIERTLTRDVSYYDPISEGLSKISTDIVLTGTYKRLRMLYKGYDIMVGEHKTDYNNHGWKLQIGKDEYIPHEDRKRFYKTPKGVIRKINELVAQKEAEEQAEKNHKLRKEAFLSEMSVKFPLAEQDDYREDAVELKFSNGIYVLVKFSQDYSKDDVLAYKYWVAEIRHYGVTDGVDEFITKLANV